MRFSSVLFGLVNTTKASVLPTSVDHCLPIYLKRFFNTYSRYVGTYLPTFVFFMKLIKTSLKRVVNCKVSTEWHRSCDWIVSACFYYYLLIRFFERNFLDRFLSFLQIFDFERKLFLKPPRQCIYICNALLHIYIVYTYLPKKLISRSI